MKVIFILFGFHFNFHCLDLFFSEHSGVSSGAVLKNTELTVHVIKFLQMMISFSLTLTFRFHGSAGLSGCCWVWVHVQSVGQERNEYRHLFLWLV